MFFDYSAFFKQMKPTLGEPLEARLPKALGLMEGQKVDVVDISKKDDHKPGFRGFYITVGGPSS